MHADSDAVAARTVDAPHSATRRTDQTDVGVDADISFDAAFDQAPVGMALVALDGRYLRLNRRFCTLLGQSAQRLQGRMVAEVTHPDDIAADLAGVERLLSGEITAYTVDKRYVTATNSIVWATKSTSLLLRADGTPLYYIVQVHDITERKDYELALARERKRLHEAELIGRMGSWEIDVDTARIHWSDAMFELRGLNRQEIGEDWNAAYRLVHPDDRERVRSAIAERISTGEPLYERYRATRASDDELRWFDTRAEGVFEDGRLVRVAGTVVDVTDDVRAAEKATADSALQQAIITASPDIIFVYDLVVGATVWSNRSISSALGYAADRPDDAPAVTTDVLARFLPADDGGEFESTLIAARDTAGNDVGVHDHRLVHADGSNRWFSRRTAVLHRDTAGRVTQVVGVLRDITEARGIEQRLQHSALHDSLTDLPNRALLVDRLDLALARSKRDHREVAILFVDLDGFKRVNDTAGHAAGDAVLTETARRLQATLRAGDTVARVGGDEFVIVIEPWNRNGSAEPTEGTGGALDRGRAVRVAERVASALRQPITVNETEHVVTASIGVTYAGLPLVGEVVAPTADRVLQDADAAMYQAKKQGKDRFEVFERSMRTDLVEHGRVERLLRRSLRSSPELLEARVPAELPALSAVYQPVFDADSGALIGFEALARLMDTDAKNISPDIFIKIAEDSGLIRPLGLHMLEQACRQLAAWRRQRAGLTELTMAVNVSALQAQHTSLGEDVCRILDSAGLAPRDLVLELSETALLQAAQSTITALQTLRDEGVGIAIDDFGTGYASLRYLATLPISSLKIDKSFTAGLPLNKTSIKIVHAVAGLAADLGLACVVEGVETEAQRAALPSGVQLQGWLMGRAQSGPLTDIAGLMKSVNNQTPHLPGVVTR